ncbi:MAG TPA: membrane protein insertion efficiency factor YidD [Gammaproteobacteria bacterium]
MNRVTELCTRALIGAIRLYQLAVSPWLRGNCRHWPTCSAYAASAVRRYGPLRGSWLSVKRVGRCHPWGSSGYDPVPEDRSRPPQPGGRIELG